MRTAVLTGLLVVSGYAATAQLTLLPQVGFENSKTSIQLNDGKFDAPIGVKFSPQIGVRLDYKFKQGHGPYLGLSTSRSIVVYNINGITPSTAPVAGDMQIRFEGGYQYSTKPIALGNSSKAKKPTTVVKRTCDGREIVVRSHCGAKKQTTAQKKAKTTWMRIQPSIGMGFIPSPKENVVTKTEGSSYSYNAGNWNTAIVAGTGFEFGRGSERLFTVSLQYFNAVGNLDKEAIVITDGIKSTTTHVDSRSSGWGLKVGIPFNLSNPVSKYKRSEKRAEECREQYRIQRSYNKCGNKKM